MSKKYEKIDSKKPDIKPKLELVPEPEAKPIQCEDAAQTSAVGSVVNPPTPSNVFQGVGNQSNDTSACYDNPTPVMSNTNTPVVSAAAGSSAPTPVLMVYHSILYIPVSSVTLSVKS